MKVYESVQKLTKAMIFHNIFSVKSLTFVPFRSIAMYFLHFIISYHDKQNFSVCYCTVLPLDNIGKCFNIIKQKVIFSISQILNRQLTSKSQQTSNIFGIFLLSHNWCHFFERNFWVPHFLDFTFKEGKSFVL